MPSRKQPPKPPRPKALTPIVLNSWVWHNISVDLPEDWEMLQFANDAEQGRIAFADRSDFRLELSWRRVGNRPDLERMRSDYASRLLNEMDHSEANIADMLDWSGLKSVKNGKVSTRLLNHFGESRMLIEAVFRWNDAPDLSLEEQILSSLMVDDGDASAFQAWRCFGLDLSVPSAFTLSDVQALPASTVMEFGYKKPDKATIRAERRGLLKFWLKGSVIEWLVRQLPRKPKTLESTQYSEAGHDIFRIKGTLPYGSGWGSLFMRQKFESVGWICPEDKRLYTLGALSRPSHASLFEKQSVQLSCCAHCVVSL